MRREDRQITDVQEIREILAEATICRIAFCDGDRPYMVPMNFGVDGDRLYLHCAPEGKKLELMAANPNVCFEVDIDTELIESEVACGWSVRYRSVIGHGRIQKVEDPHEKASGLQAVMGQVSDKTFTLPEEAVRGVTVLRVDIESMSGKKAGF